MSAASSVAQMTVLIASRIWCSTSPERTRRLGGRRVEDGEREKAEVDADGCEQGDQIAAGDGLAFVGVSKRRWPPEKT